MKIQTKQSFLPPGQDTRLQQQGLLKCKEDFTVNSIQSQRNQLFERLKINEIPSKLYHVSADNTNSSNKNLFSSHVQGGEVQNLKVHFLISSALTKQFKQVLTLKILFSVPQLSYNMNKPGLLHFELSFENVTSAENRPTLYLPSMSLAISRTE